MPVDAPVPEHEALRRELLLVREKGLPELRRLHLPALHQAAAAAGLTTTARQPQPAAIEQLIRMAVDRFGGGRHQRAARCTFGLVGGTRFEPPTERRKQAAKSCGVGTEAFRKSHEKTILEQTAESILALVREHAMHRADGKNEQRRPSGGRSAVATDTIDARSKAQIEPIDCAVPNSDSLSRLSRRRRSATSVVAASLALLVVAGGVVLARHYWWERTWNGMTAAELERRYDGKLPWGDDDNSRCANGNAPPSLVVQGATTPPVMGPAGVQVGTVQLRRSQICPTVVWARILWHGDEQQKYQIPSGWTLHVVMHGPDTNTVIDEPETSKVSEVPYALSRMISSARGCVYAEVHFAKDDKPDVNTSIARTSCVRP
jgi:hypothetical protein